MAFAGKISKDTGGNSATTRNDKKASKNNRAAHDYANTAQIKKQSGSDIMLTPEEFRKLDGPPLDIKSFNAQNQPPKGPAFFKERPRPMEPAVLKTSKTAKPGVMLTSKTAKPGVILTSKTAKPGVMLTSKTAKVNNPLGVEAFNAQRSEPKSRSSMNAQPKPANVRAKLEIGSPDDKFEKEADVMADKVTKSPEGIQKGGLENEKEEVIQSKQSVQRALHEEDEVVQQKPGIQKSSDGKSQASSALTSQLSSTKGSGQSISKGVQGEMGSKIGADFSGVKVHSDNQAADMSSSIGAKAFTHGNDIYFNKGEYNPTSKSGKHLLAHELTHTVQQGEGVDKTLQMQVEKSSETEEPTIDKWRTREIQKGENPFRLGLEIQQAYGLKMSAMSIAEIIMAKNNIRDAGGIQIGAKLQVPAESFFKKERADVEVKKTTAILKGAKYTNGEYLKDIVEFIFLKYGVFSSNYKIQIVESLLGAWAKTGGAIKTGKIQTITVRKNLFEQDFSLLVRVLEHESLHVEQRSGEVPITDEHEREFLTSAWTALNTITPEMKPEKTKKFATEALRQFELMPDDRKEINDTMSDEDKEKVKGYLEKKEKLEQILAP